MFVWGVLGEVFEPAGGAVCKICVCSSTTASLFSSDAPLTPNTSIFVPLTTAVCTSSTGLYPINCLPGCRAVTPDFGGLLKRELFLEGAFRNAHARLRTHAESGECCDRGICCVLAGTVHCGVVSRANHSRI
jgi:hypothetical protein